MTSKTNRRLCCCCRDVIADAVVDCEGEMNGEFNQNQIEDSSLGHDMEISDCVLAVAKDHRQCCCLAAAIGN